MAKLQFLKFHNLQLTLPISSRAGGNIQDYAKSDCYGKHVNVYMKLLDSPNHSSH